MTLLITIFAAVISTAVWYKSYPDNSMNVHYLCFMYWGASLMWLADAIFEYLEEGIAIFQPELMDMVHDGFLGLIIVALGLVVWVVLLLVKDPKNVFVSMLKRTDKKTN